MSAKEIYEYENLESFQRQFTLQVNRALDHFHPEPTSGLTTREGRQWRRFLEHSVNGLTLAASAPEFAVQATAGPNAGKFMEYKGGGEVIWFAPTALFLVDGYSARYVRQTPIEDLWFLRDAPAMVAVNPRWVQIRGGERPANLSDVESVFYDLGEWGRKIRGQIIPPDLEASLGREFVLLYTVILMERFGAQVRLTNEMTGVLQKAMGDLLSSATEGGSNYWYRIDKFVKPKKVTFRTLPPDIYRHIDYPLNAGGAIHVKDMEDQESHPDPVVVDLPGLRKAWLLFGTNPRYIHHFWDFVRTNGDATTGDVFFQYAVFGDVLYG